jgi:hypothetical protein
MRGGDGSSGDSGRGSRIPLADKAQKEEMVLDLSASE